MKRRDFVRNVGIGIVGSAMLPGYIKATQVLPLPPQQMPKPTPGAVNSLRQSVRFGVLTDLHYADIDTSGSRFYRDSVSKAADCVQVCNAEAVDFVIELGDLKDQGTDQASTISFLQAIESEIRKFEGPIYHVLGNHDMDRISKLQFLENVTNTGIPKTSTHYSFDIKGIHFTVLDANHLSNGDDYDSGNFIWTDSNIPREQLDWLVADLAHAKGPAVLFVHQLLDGTGTVYVKNAAAVREVIEASGKVIAVFQGHHHSGSYQRINGIHYYTLKGMIENAYPANNAFAMVEIVPGEKIIINGYVNVSDQELPLI